MTKYMVSTEAFPHREISVPELCVPISDVEEVMKKHGIEGSAAAKELDDRSVPAITMPNVEPLKWHLIEAKVIPWDCFCECFAKCLDEAAKTWPKANNEELGK